MTATEGEGVRRSELDVYRRMAVRRDAWAQQARTPDEVNEDGQDPYPVMELISDVVERKLVYLVMG